MESFNWLSLGQLKYLLKKPKMQYIVYAEASEKFPEISVQKVIEHLWRSLQICSCPYVAELRSLQILNNEKDSQVCTDSEGKLNMGLGCCPRLPPAMAICIQSIWAIQKPYQEHCQYIENFKLLLKFQKL